MTILSKKTFLVFLLLIFISLSGYSQSYKNEIKKGENSFQIGKYDDAAKYFMNASKKIKKIKKKHLELFYKLGFCQMQLKEYKNASNSFAKYQSISKRHKPKYKELKEVTEWREWCITEYSNFGSEVEGNGTIKITNISKLNSTMNDYGAILTYDKTLVIFSSNRRTKEDKDLLDLNADIYASEYNNGSISDPQRIITLSKKFEEISTSVAKDNLILYFSLSKDFNETANIYYCKKTNGKWEEPKKIKGSINSKEWDGHPSISADGSILYFVSDRPGSRGKDIYFSVKQDDGEWGQAKNIGGPINTKYDEVTPHIDSTGKKLYFSSKGHIGEGGFDIYYSEFEASRLWGKPINIGKAINSQQDDVFYTTTSDPDIALYSSMQPGGKGVYDIYMIKKIEENGIKKFAPEDKPINIVDKDTDEVIIISSEKDKEEAETKEKTISKTQEAKIAKTETEKAKTETEKAVTKTITQKEIKKPQQKYVQKENDFSNKASSRTSNKNVNLYTAQVEGLYFKVQIGAYKKHITKYDKVFTSKLDPKKITEKYYPPLYKYTIGKNFTIRNATNYKLVIRNIGYSDAFLTCYYNNKRIPMSEAKKVIKTKALIN